MEEVERSDARSHRTSIRKRKLLGFDPLFQSCSYEFTCDVKNVERKDSIKQDLMHE